MKVLFIFSFLSFMLIPERKGKGYDFNKPDETIVLPQELSEISALTDVTNDILASVQDENGIIYFISIKERKVLYQWKLLPDGDYEGLTYNDSTFYILRSDAMLFTYSVRSHTLDSAHLEIPVSNNEGLGWDHMNNYLLISCKSNPESDTNTRDLRLIYGWYPSEKRLTGQPVLQLSVKSINDYAKVKGIPMEMRTKKTGESIAKPLQFRPSSIAVHPVTNEYYILSANSSLILVLDRNKNIKNLVKLDPALFPKPEGITFLKNGRLIISNEGKEQEPDLKVFNYKR
jgi:uncharacterized protein YjiK